MSQNSTLRCVIFTAMMLSAAFASPTALAQTQAANWTKATPLPRALDEMQAVTVNGKIYLVGGAWDERTEGKVIEHYTDGFMTEFDPQTNQWRERSRGPEGLTHQGIAVLNGKIYLAGGFAGGHHTMPSAGVYSYDPATDKWQTLAPLSDVRGGVALASAGGMIHAIARSITPPPILGVKQRRCRRPGITPVSSSSTARSTSSEDGRAKPATTSDCMMFTIRRRTAGSRRHRCRRRDRASRSRNITVCFSLPAATIRCRRRAYIPTILQRISGRLLRRSPTCEEALPSPPPVE